MLPSLSEDPVFEQMFLEEAELAAKIKHPAVCEILDLGEQDGTLYLVMEWINGEPLNALIKLARKQTGFPYSVAARIGKNAALGLHAAHELKNDDGQLLGLVHRDVSPQNILVSYDGVVKIVDFGVAKATAAAEHGRTQAGQIKGKVPFMAPEQAIGGAVDRRTDVFALGIVLWQLVTGKHPFRGASDMVTLARICDKQQVPRASTVAPNVPPSLDDAIARALDKQPSMRFQTMAEFAHALDRVLLEMDRMGRGVETATFVRGLVGERAEKRKIAIREAIELADARALRRGNSTSWVSPSLEASDAGPVSGVSGISEPSAASHDGRMLPSVSGVTALGAEMDTGPGARRSPRSRGRSTALVVTLASACLVVAALTSTGVHNFALSLASDGPAPAAQPPSSPAESTRAVQSPTPPPSPPPAALPPPSPTVAPIAVAPPVAPAEETAAPTKATPRPATTTPPRPRPSSAPAAPPAAAPPAASVQIKVKDPGF
jgi:serine/threonine-protein kinase